jgi:phage terminase small subunit
MPNAALNPREQLDPREQRFVELYIETSNATRSALAAGYGRNYQNAGVYASRLLKKARIKDAVDRRNAELMIELDFTPSRIIAEIAKIAGVNSADFVTIDDNGLPHIDMSGVKRRHMAAVSSIENTEKGVKYKLHDKLKALDMLAKMARLYPAERTELTGADGGPIQSANISATVHKIDIASLEPEQRDQLKQVLLALKAQHEESEMQANRGAEVVPSEERLNRL